MGESSTRTWLRTLAVTSAYDESEDLTREIVLARENVVFPAASRAELCVKRVNATPRKRDDQVELAFVVDGDVVATHATPVNAADVASLAIDNDSADVKQLAVAVKIVRTSSADDSMFFDRDTREARLQIWVDVKGVERNDAARKTAGGSRDAIAVRPETAVTIAAMTTSPSPAVPAPAASSTDATLIVPLPSR